MSMSITPRWWALGLCASLCFSGCDDDPDRPSTTIDPSKADPPSLDIPNVPRPPGVSSGNRVGTQAPQDAIDAGSSPPSAGPTDAGTLTDAGARGPQGPGDFLDFDAALALRASE